MISLILSISCSVVIYILFRLFPRYNIDTFQAIVFNYFTALSCGVILFGKEFNPAMLENMDWIPYAIICGMLFIMMFLVVGNSAQKNGVASTSVASKMSMALTMLLMILFYNEALSILKICGISLAIVGVVAVSWRSKTKDETGSKTVLWLLILLFVGNGILDFVLNFVQKFKQQFIPSSLFSAISFGIAGIVGVIILAFYLYKRQKTFEWKNVLAGIALGIPNYFSVYLLLLAYDSSSWSDSTVLAITNVSVVLLTAFVGFGIFKEKINRLKFIGLTAALGAIISLYFASSAG